jgi:hypothetical protein
MAEVENYTSTTPRDIMNSIQSNYGVKSKYWTVWKSLNKKRKRDLDDWMTQRFWYLVPKSW